MLDGKLYYAEFPIKFFVQLKLTVPPRFYVPTDY